MYRASKWGRAHWPIDPPGTDRSSATFGFLSMPLAPPMGLEMGALGSISADARHKAAAPGPHRGPRALGVPWGHAPPVWLDIGAHNTPDWTHDSAPGTL